MEHGLHRGKLAAFANTNNLQFVKQIGFGIHGRAMLVERPFCLDFAAAYLDALPTYFPPMGKEWEAEKLEQFGEEDWAKVLKVLDELELYGIYQTDVTPTNISV